MTDLMIYIDEVDISFNSLQFTIEFISSVLNLLRSLWKKKLKINIITFIN